MKEQPCDACGGGADVEGKHVIMIMGRSGSGKSTLESRLVTYRPRLFHKVVSVTTRPKREGEVNGQEYYFIDQTNWDKLDEAGKLVQKTSFAGNFYGSTISEYETDHPFATLVVVPSSAKTFGKALNDRGIHVIYVYFDISTDALRRNMERRGDDPTEVDLRLERDDLNVQFTQSFITPDYVVTDADLDDSLHIRFLRWLIPSEGEMTVRLAGQQQ